MAITLKDLKDEIAYAEEQHGFTDDTPVVALTEFHGAIEVTGAVQSHLDSEGEKPCLEIHIVDPDADRRA